MHCKVRRTLLQGGDERVFVHALATPHIDEDCAWLHGGHRACVKELVRRLGEGRGHDNVVALCHHVTQLLWREEVFQDTLRLVFLRELRAPSQRDDGHAKGLGERAARFADIAVADDPQGLACTRQLSLCAHSCKRSQRRDRTMDVAEWRRAHGRGAGHVQVAQSRAGAAPRSSSTSKASHSPRFCDARMRGRSLANQLQAVSAYSASEWL